MNELTKTHGEAGNGAQAPKARPPIATICAWCKGLHIMNLERKETDVVLILLYGKDVKVSLNGENLKLSHSVCDECRRRDFPNSFKITGA